jgi:hypothetical protein
VLGESIHAMADRDHAHRRTVRGELREAAAALGLQLRPPDAGRARHVAAAPVPSLPKLVRVPVKGVVR